MSFVINLKRREDRLEIFKNRYILNSSPEKKIHIEYGFDAKFYENEDEEEIHLFKTKFENLKPGEIGCFLSHIRLFKKLVESEEPYFIIFEDDALFCDNFHEKLDGILAELPENFDILYFGGRFFPDFIMSIENYVDVTENIISHVFPNMNVIDNNAIYLYTFDLVQRMQHDRTTHGYIISKKMAGFFLNIFNSSEKISIEVDNWMIRTMIYFNIKIYDSKPLLCYSPWNSESDIR